ncbi:thymidylate kinase [Microbacterium phage Katzastrophic]|uniref:thymidylate kinase n=1 Tax=Microbacterium phage Katzastrophic TaxID=2912654 RepID=UPI00242DF9FA|nr:thymidylate kinase [Microbacterium phage Katzastrophic]UKH48467.1 thymidylate kinase [Microbacterium phage Katzastrophic]
MTAKVFLIEGADGTGKTTFVKRMASRDLSNGDPIPRVIHNDASDHKLPGSLYRHYRAQLLDAISFRESGISTYIDRSFLSELVYGNLYRGRARISERQARRLERFARKHGIVLLGMTADLAIRRSRVEARGETFDPKQPFVDAFYSQHFAARGRYWTTADSTSAPVLD